MAKGIHKLNARQVTTTNTPGRYSDGASLYLRITNIEQKRWVLRYTPSPGAKPREMGLGSAGSGGISLAQARELARYAVKQDDDPIRQRQIQVQKEDVSVPMFGVFADEYIETQASNFRNDKHIA